MSQGNCLPLNSCVKKSEPGDQLRVDGNGGRKVKAMGTVGPYVLFPHVTLGFVTSSNCCHLRMTKCVCFAPSVGCVLLWFAGLPRRCEIF